MTRYLFMLLLAALGQSQEHTSPAANPLDSLFYESFSVSLADSVWVPSRNAKYTGEWIVGKGPQSDSTAGEQGLFLKHQARHHAISAPLGGLLDPSKGPIVVQYEVRFHAATSCGGAYLKLLKAGSFEPAAFSGEDEYIIMFGPDKCGQTDKVHFIVRHQNPITKAYEEKHLDAAPPTITDKLTHLYTLVMWPNSTFEVLVDLESKVRGSLLENFTPAFNPPAEIDDPTDHKPDDWVDEAEIPDPDITKPDDWDQPALIPDPDATIPDGWQQGEDAEIPDPTAVKPREWDEEDDGDWEAPLVRNPKCSVGCGPWTPPQIRNPAYRGPWKQPMVANPAYRGEWKARQLPNPAFFVDSNPHASLAPMSHIGFELWTMNQDVEFDNIIVGSNPIAALEFAEKTWRAKRENELARQESTADLLTQIQDFFAGAPAMIAVVAALVVGAIAGTVYLCINRGEAAGAQPQDDGSEEQAHTQDEREPAQTQDDKSEGEPAQPQDDKSEGEPAEEKAQNDRTGGQAQNKSRESTARSGGDEGEEQEGDEDGEEQEQEGDESDGDDAELPTIRQRKP